MTGTNIKLTSVEIRKLCTAGNMAPSGGNSQPWKVVVDENKMFVKIDSVSVTSFLDVLHYAAFFSIGCFLENVLLEAGSLGLVYRVEYHEFQSINKPVVTIIFLRRSKQHISNDELYKYISKRITNRHVYNGEIIDRKKIEHLQKIIESNKEYQFHAVSTYDEKEEIATLLGLADAIRFLNDRAFNEMMSEFRWDEREVLKTKDGLDMNTLELPKNAGKMYKLLNEFPFLRKLLPQKALADMARPLLVGCSHLCVISTSQQLTSTAMIKAGSIFEKLWLTSAKLGIALQPWSVLPFFLIRLNLHKGLGFSRSEIDALRNIEKNLHKALPYPQKRNILFIFRLFVTDKLPSAHSLRRPWKDFATIK